MSKAPILTKEAFSLTATKWAKHMNDWKTFLIPTCTFIDFWNRLETLKLLMGREPSWEAAELYIQWFFHYISFNFKTDIHFSSGNPVLFFKHRKDIKYSEGSHEF